MYPADEMDEYGNNPKNKKAQETEDGNVPAGASNPIQSPELFYSPDTSMDRGWVKSYRKFEDWQWYKKQGMFHLFHHLLYRANHKPKRWEGIVINRGQLVSSRNKLAEQTGLSVRQIRTCLDRLTNSGELTIKTTKQYSIITICNYDIYQAQENQNDQANDPRPTHNRPTTDHKQELKNDKNEKNKPLFCSIPLKGNGTCHNVYEDDLEVYKKIYPVMDIERAILFISRWNQDNPTKRKTPTGIKSHITRFLNSLHNQNKFRKDSKNDRQESISVGRQFLMQLEQEEREREGKGKPD